MNRIAKTLSNVGIYLLLVTLLTLMFTSIILISIKSLIELGYSFLSDFGKWLQEITNTSLSNLQSIGITILIFTIIVYIVLIIVLVLINLRHALYKRIGYITGFIIAILLIIATLLPFIIFSASQVTDEIIDLVFGILFVFIGLNGGVLLAGSIIGIFFAKTTIDDIEKVKKTSNK